MALQGTLKDFSLADIFQLIGLQKKTGVLTLKGGEETVTVSFLDGSVVAADSLPKRLEDRLGIVLVKSRQVSQEQLQEALKVQKQTQKRLGSVLVEQKFIGREALKEALKIQVSQTIFRLFRWHDGEYRFSQDQKLDYDRENVLPLSAESVLMEGARILDEWPMIERKIGRFDGIFKRTANAEPSAGAGGAKRTPVLSAEERGVLGLVDGQRTIQDLIESSSLSEFDTCRVLYELVDRELVEKKGEGTSSAPVTRAAPARREVSSRRELRPAWGWVLAVVTVVSVVTGYRNPWNGWSILSGQSEAQELLQRQASLTRMERIRYALRVYFLQNRGFPKDLNYLVLGGLLRSSDLRDPSGRDYIYSPTASGYSLSGPGEMPLKTGILGEREGDQFHKSHKTRQKP